MRHFIKQVMGHPGEGRGPCWGAGPALPRSFQPVGEMLAPWGPRQYPPTARMLQPLQPACGGGTSDGSRGASAWSPESFPVTRPLPGHRKPRQAVECSPLQGLLDSAFMGPEPLPSFGSEAKEEGRGVCARSVDRAACPAFCSSVLEVWAVAGSVTAVCPPSRDRVLGNPKGRCLGS